MSGQDEDRSSAEVGSEQMLRSELGAGKYTRWAAGLSVDQLVALVWLVGEFTMRMGSTEQALLVVERDKHRSGMRRAWEALRLLVDFKRAPMSLDEVRHAMRAAMQPPKEEQ